MAMLYACLSDHPYPSDCLLKAFAAAFERYQRSKESWPEGPGVHLPLKGAVFCILDKFKLPEVS